ncbi:unnamed protein product [Arctogadus glacialis]
MLFSQISPFGLPQQSSSSDRVSVTVPPVVPQRSEVRHASAYSVPRGRCTNRQVHQQAGAPTGRCTNRQVHQQAEEEEEVLGEGGSADRRSDNPLSTAHTAPNVNPTPR